MNKPLQQNYSPFGLDLFGDPIRPKKAGPIAEKFEFPPFSVLDARSGEWQERKRAWTALGIQSEIGRKDKLTYKGNVASFDYYRVKEGLRESTDTQSTSIFDPVLCELMYRWFCKDGGQIIDPFAGGSVRGIVAALSGFNYWGCDLNNEQVCANREQQALICPEKTIDWIHGDSIELLESAPFTDFVFSCPPYGDLERYSDDSRDLSTMEYHTFIAAYKRIILRCSQKLKSTGYACFVVGDFRDKRTGNYRGFVADTVHAFRECGLNLYNDAILITVVGSLSMRIDKQFSSNRKLGKTHQNILIFRK